MTETPTRLLYVLLPMATLTLLAPPVLAGPQPVSPGSAAGAAHTAPACPTFSWTADAAAGDGYEVLVERAEPAAREVQAPPVRELLPTGATAWTLPGERCLDPGRYAWTVRPLPGETAWAEPRLFRVEAAPAPLPDLVGALAALSPDQRRLVRRLLEEPDVIRPPGEPVLGAPEGTLVAVRGEVADPTGETYGVEGVASSLDGAGLHAVHTDPAGADLLLDGPSPVALSDTGLTVDSPDPETFSFANDGTGSLTLSLDDADLVTTATDRDTLGGLSCAGGQIAEWSGSQWVCAEDDGQEYSGGNQIEIAGFAINVLEGPGSGLDADTLDGLQGSAYAPSSHGHFGGSWSGAGPQGLLVDNASPGAGHSGLWVRMSHPASGDFSTGLRGENLGTGANGFGVWGTHAGSGFGVYGESAGTAGAGVAGLGLRGVQGLSTLFGGDGVLGQSTATTGDGKGVRGESSSGLGFGVYGENLATDGFGVGVYGRSASSTGWGVHGEGGAGVVGESADGFGVGVVGAATSTAAFGDATGVAGTTSTGGPASYGVHGTSAGSTGFGIGVMAESASPDGFGAIGENLSGGVGLWARGNGIGHDHAALRATNSEGAGGIAAYLSNGSTFATAHLQNDGVGQVLWMVNGGTGPGGVDGGDFIRALNNTSTDIQFRVLTDGEVRSDVGFFTPAADFAEMLPAAPGLAAGEVLVVGPTGRLERSSDPRQTSVAGVYSTAPGFVGGHPVEGAPEGHAPLAVVGVVPVWTSAENGPIRPGDLLVTASLPGHAMRADAVPGQGTVIGKALEALPGGTGLVRILLSLQ